MSNITMPTRDEAIFSLYSLTGCGILNEQIVSELEGIIKCLELENDGFMVWGADKKTIDFISSPYENVGEDYSDELDNLLDGFRYVPPKNS